MKLLKKISFLIFDKIKTKKPETSKGFPDLLKTKLSEPEQQAKKIIDFANTARKTPMPRAFQLGYHHCLPDHEILTPDERAQSICFISRYEHLPVFDKAEILEIDGKFWLKNLQDLRHLLNEYRSIVYNKKDSIYYNTIHEFCREKLTNNVLNGLWITVNDEKGNNITDTFLKVLDERNKSIKIVLRMCDFDYIYNGILQHSDHRHTDKFLTEYESGELNYIFIKHAKVLEYIKGCLRWHYEMLKQLTSLTPGPLYP